MVQKDDAGPRSPIFQENMQVAGQSPLPSSVYSTILFEGGLKKALDFKNAHTHTHIMKHSSEV